MSLLFEATGNHFKEVLSFTVITFVIFVSYCPKHKNCVQYIPSELLEYLNVSLNMT